MHTFEEDLAVDDFEVEITDLEPENERSPISAAIAVLRSRISLTTLSLDSSDNVVEDNFEVEVTELPEDNAESSSGPERSNHVWGKIKARSVYQFFRPLEPLHVRLPGKKRILRLAIVGIAILAMFGIVFGGLPSARDAILGLFPSPKPAPAPAPDLAARKFRRFRGFPGELISIGNISISLNPIPGVTVIPWNPITNISNVLGPVPQECSSANVPQGPDSANLPFGNRVGRPPLWVTGFQGNPTRLTGFTRASPPLYGWVHQITLMLESNVDEAVMLQGANLMDGTSLLFDDPDSEQVLTTFLTLKLDISSISSDSTDLQWGVRPVSLYIPSAGCYYLKASWSGGSWEAIFAAGA